MPANPTVPNNGRAYAWIDSALAALHKARWHRSPRTLEGRAGPVVRLGDRPDRPVLNFASNDYLGLAGDARLANAAAAAAKTYGTGSTGSRLIAGHRSLHRELELALADLKGTEDAIVFSTGYAANSGTLAALLGSRDWLLGDRYNHSSLKSGAKLSGATVADYGHGDLADLRRQLAADRHRFRRCAIATDTVFSMDGDLCPLPDLLDLAAEFDCMVVADEAHGTGVLGATGAGAAEQLGCSGRPFVQTGTLSKALGSLGGYAAGSAALVDFLRNRAPSWVYSTGLSPADAAAALAAVRLVRAEPERRDRLWANANYLKAGLGAIAAEFPETRLLPTDSPILCLQVRDPETVLALGDRLLAAGCWVGAIRPPTVPVSRLRITVMATHERDHCDRLLDALADALRSA